jgi:hypothetical protein
MMIRTMLAAGALLALSLGAQAQQVVRDAQTGQFRAPTAAEARQLEQIRARQGFNANRGILTGTLNPQPIRMPDGSDFLETTEGELNYSVVVVLPDGRLARKCVGSAELAEKVVRGEMPSFAKNLLERLNER